MKTYTCTYVVYDVINKSYECSIDISSDHRPTLNEVAVELYYVRWHTSNEECIIVDKAVVSFHNIRLSESYSEKS